MLIIDHIYIINLKKNINNLQKSLYQLKKNNIFHYTIIDAIDGKNEIYSDQYEEIIQKMDKNFVKHNFSRGALGCLLSHLKAIHHAKKHKFNHIIILEDDFIFIDSFHEKFERLLTNIPNFDLIYLGKKQGNLKNYHKVKDIHKYTEYKNITDYNDEFYIPNYQTWGTHALLIKQTLFDKILEFENNIIAPIDIMLMSLYKEFSFLCCKNDLIISDDCNSDILNKKLDWGWELKNFSDLRKFIKINKIFIVGSNYHHTHNYIHEMYFKFFNYYYPNIPIKIVDTDEYNNFKNCLIICSPIHFTNEIIYDPKNYYIIHLDSPNFKDINDIEINKYIDKYLKQYNNYKILLCRQKIKDIKYFEYQSSFLCLPWFSNYLYQETIFFQNKNFKEKDYYLYIGSIWDCNIKIIKELIETISGLNFKLIIKGRIFNLSEKDKSYVMNHKNVIFLKFLYEAKYDFENSIQYIFKKYTIRGILSIQGDYHFDNYISNRIFECISLGYIILTNNPIVKQYFRSVLYDYDLKNLLETYENIIKDNNVFIKIFQDQYHEYYEKFYGFNHIDKLLSFINMDPNFYIHLEEIKKENYKVYFSHKIITDFPKITSNECLRKCFKEYKDITISNINLFDPFLIKKLIRDKNYTIYADIFSPEIFEITKLCKSFNKPIMFM